MCVKKYLAAYFLIGLFLSSCISTKKFIYFLEFPDSAPVSVQRELVTHEQDEYWLQYNVIIYITLRTTSSELNEILDISGNVENQMRNMSGSTIQGGDIFFLTGFSLDEEGEVELPLLGRVKLVGLSI